MDEHLSKGKNFGGGLSKNKWSFQKLFFEQGFIYTKADNEKFAVRFYFFYKNQVHFRL